MLNEKTLWSTNLFGNLVFPRRALRVHCQHKLETWTGDIFYIHLYMSMRYKTLLHVHVCTCTHNLKKPRSPSELPYPYTCMYSNCKFQNCCILKQNSNHNNNNAHPCEMLEHCTCAIYHTTSIRRQYVS